jgi:hypothetical protein
MGVRAAAAGPLRCAPNGGESFYLRLGSYKMCGIVRAADWQP